MKPIKIFLLSNLLLLLPLATFANKVCLCFHSTVGNGSWHVTEWSSSTSYTCADLSNVADRTRCGDAGIIGYLPNIGRKLYDGVPEYTQTPTPTPTPTSLVNNGNQTNGNLPPSPSPTNQICETITGQYGGTTVVCSGGGGPQPSSSSTPYPTSSPY